MLHLVSLDVYHDKYSHDVILGCLGNQLNGKEGVPQIRILIGLNNMRNRV